jgi:hypothetical protein
MEESKEQLILVMKVYRLPDGMYKCWIKSESGETKFSTKFNSEDEAVCWAFKFTGVDIDSIKKV